MKRRNVLIAAAIIVLATIVTYGVYLSSKSKAPAVTPRPTASSSVSPTAASAGPSASATSWSTADVTVPSVLQSGTALLVAIRAGAHPAEGYDRLAIDFRGQAPGVTARYVNQVVQDASGAPVTLSGGAYLQLTFQPAAAHDESGTPSEGVATNVQTTGFTGLKSYKLNGDFEGVLSIAIGQSSKAGFKIGRADHGGVSTIYIDIPRP